MASLVNKLLNNVKPRHDDDFVDRANYVYTALLFGLCATTIAAKQYVGEPIQCWIPPEFLSGWETYAESYCFAENTYFVPMHEDFPRDPLVRKGNEIQYYQWVPLLLAAQMIACILPKLLFSAVNFNLDFTVEKLVSMASMFDKNKESYKVRENLKHTTAGLYMDKIFNLRRTKINYSRNNRLTGVRKMFYRSAVTKFYLLYKLINLASALFQVYLLNSYFWPDYDFWGIGFVRDLYNEHRWKESGEFPRVTFCDIEIREIAEKPIKHTLQCVLMINMFAEKIYVVVWFWLLGLSVLNAFNLLHWVWCTHFNFNNIDFIDHYLDLNEIQREDFEPHLPKFVNDYLAMDGVTALRLLELNCGEVETTQMVKNLWDNFYKGIVKKDDLKKSDDETDMDLYGPNQMTQSTCTTSTSVTMDSSPSANFSNLTTLPIARKCLGGNFPQSNV